MNFIVKKINLFTKIFNKYFNTSIIKKLFKLLVITVIFYNNTLFAIGLSEIKIHSYLNEPLNASIKIIGAEELDPISLIADLADIKDFMRAGIPRSLLLSHLKFAIKQIDEDLVVYISSNIVIKDPFFDLLLQLTWPEGTMIKSYSILLNPRPAGQKNLNTNPDKQLVKDKKVLANLKNTNPDEIFASSLEQPNETELLINNKLDFPKNLPTKKLENSLSIEPNSGNHNINQLEHLNYINDNSKNNLNSHSFLTKLINNLQNFSENSKKNKINYQKLLELTPDSISLSKDEEKLAENFAISQVNSELNELRGERFKKTNLNNDNNDNKNQLNSQNLNIQPLNSGETNNNLNSKHYNVYYSNAHNLELFANKNGNNLLLAFFLVSATMYVFYKLISATQANVGLIDMELNENNLSPSEHPNVNLKSNAIVDKLPKQFTKSNSLDKQQDKFNNIEVEDHSIETSNIGFLRDEELELKMGLANQYIAAGDKKSAKDLLQEIINVKDQKYKNQIKNMLNMVN